MATADRPLSVRESAAEKHVHPDTIKRAIRSGRLSATRTPGGHLRISRDALDAAFATA